MLTNQTFYFVFVIVTAVIWFRFGFDPLLFIAAGLVLLWLWKRLRHPRAWKGDGYAIRIQTVFREEAWIHYEEAGRILSLRAEWGDGKRELLVLIDEKVYFPPDYKNALSEPRIAEIQKRVSEALAHLQICHAFTRMGWTSAT